MMTGQGPYGPIEMGGMFTTLKVRAGLAPGDYKDPGNFSQPPGTRAWEWTGAPGSDGAGASRLPPAPRQAPADTAPAGASARKPAGHGGHH